MEPELKKISVDGVRAALAKATVYRNLNEPEEAESICRDVLEVDPTNQEGLRLLGLAITDQFSATGENRYSEAENIFQQLADLYDQFYYMGLLYERRAKADLIAGRSSPSLRTLFERAMASFAEAEKIRPVGNDEAILRWNSCVRFLQSQPNLYIPVEIGTLDTNDGPPS